MIAVGYWWQRWDIGGNNGMLVVGAGILVAMMGHRCQQWDIGGSSTKLVPAVVHV